MSRASSASQLPAPQHFDDVPAGAAEGRFEFRDDLAVAADRPVQPLQIAVDDEDQVVEFFARGQRHGAQRFRLVGLAVAQERPDLARRDGNDAAIFEIAHEARLVDGVDGAQAHGDGGELARNPASARDADRRTGRAQRAARGGNFPDAFPRCVLRGTRARRFRARRGPGNKRSRRADRRAGRGKK